MNTGIDFWHTRSNTKGAMAQADCDCHLQSNSKLRQIIDATSNYTGENPQTASHHIHLYEE